MDMSQFGRDEMKNDGRVVLRFVEDNSFPSEITDATETLARRFATIFTTWRVIIKSIYLASTNSPKNRK